MRLFIALVFDNETVERLSVLRDALHDQSERGSFVSRENLHLTLDFLGECSAEERDNAIKAIDSISFSSFPVLLDRIGTFSRDEGNIWWVGVKESMTLMKMQKELHSALVDYGLHVENRKYRPHITLGRRVITSARPGVLNIPIETTAEKIVLMLSERGEHGMIYTPLHEKTAKKAALKSFH